MIGSQRVRYRRKTCRSQEKGTLGWFERDEQEESRATPFIGRQIHLGLISDDYLNTSLFPWIYLCTYIYIYSVRMYVEKFCPIFKRNTLLLLFYFIVARLSDYQRTLLAIYLTAIQFHTTVAFITSKHPYIYSFISFYFYVHYPILNLYSIAPLPLAFN